MQREYDGQQTISWANCYHIHYEPPLVCIQTTLVLNSQFYNDRIVC
jgi:hypothetical protein